MVGVVRAKAVGFEIRVGWGVMKVYVRVVRDFMKTYSVVVTLLMVWSVWSVWKYGCVCVCCGESEREREGKGSVM